MEQQNAREPRLPLPIIVSDFWLDQKTEKVSNDRYKITLYYDKDDETELLIRVLAFGPVMKVTEPESFIEQIKQRLRMQNN